MVPPSTNLTRRQLAAALGAAAVPAPQAQAQSDNRTELLSQAKQAVVRSREALAKIKIDRSLEPATRFEA